MKKVMSVLALCGLLALSGGSAFAAQWKLAHIRPADSVIERDLQAFAKEVREATDGRIDIRIYGSSQLGDYTVVQEKVSLGSVEMSCESVSTQVDKRFLSYILPYVAKDYATAKKNFGTGTPYAKYCANLFDKQDIMVLANWPVYFGGIGLVGSQLALNLAQLARELGLFLFEEVKGDGSFVVGVEETASSVFDVGAPGGEGAHCFGFVSFYLA